MEEFFLNFFHESNVILMNTLRMLIVTDACLCLIIT